MFEIRESKTLDEEKVLELYKANSWSSAKKPSELLNALKNSHSVVTVWDNLRLIGLGNAISDGYLVVYYPHLLVHPDYHRMGVGRLIMEKFEEKYSGFHMQILVADENAVQFYKNCGFEIAQKTQSMWKYDNGGDH